MSFLSVLATTLELQLGIMVQGIKTLITNKYDLIPYPLKNLFKIVQTQFFSITYHKVRQAK